MKVMQNHSTQIDVLRAALPGLEAELNSVQSTHRKWEAFWPEREDTDETLEKFRFDHKIAALFRLCQFCLLAAGLSENAAVLKANWDASETEKWNFDFDYLDSERLDLLKECIFGIRIISVGGENSINGIERERLITLLDSTAQLVANRSIIPTNEQQVKVVMHDYLSVCFPSDFAKALTISGTLKNFQPDAGILSLEAAIEFKFATTEEAFKQQYSGILEDANGYKGSKDWTEFYAVFYMTSPFATKRKIELELRRKGIENWHVIPVYGGGSRSTPKKNPLGKSERVRSNFKTKT
jgi:hypothetical protein